MNDLIYNVSAASLDAVLAPTFVNAYAGAHVCQRVRVVVSVSVLRACMCMCV